MDKNCREFFSRVENFVISRVEISVFLESRLIVSKFLITAFLARPRLQLIITKRLHECVLINSVRYDSDCSSHSLDNRHLSS